MLVPRVQRANEQDNIIWTCGNRFQNCMLVPQKCTRMQRFRHKPLNRLEELIN